MQILLILTIFLICYYQIIQFARQEAVEDEYMEAVADVEGMLDWALSRSKSPFGMIAQVEVARDLLARAKELWRINRWHQAYQLALQSQAAIERAQQNYIRQLKTLSPH